MSDNIDVVWAADEFAEQANKANLSKAEADSIFSEAWARLPTGNRVITEETSVEIAQRYKDEFLTTTELGKEYGVTAATICNHLRKQGVEIRKKGPQARLKKNREKILQGELDEAKRMMDYV